MVITSASSSRSTYTLPKRDRPRREFEDAKYSVRGSMALELAQPHGRARYTNLASVGTATHEARLLAIPRKPLASPSHIDQAPMLSVDLAEIDDYFSQTSREDGL